MQDGPFITSLDDSKGANIFKKMFEDKKPIGDHLAKEGKIEDL
jgi:hypothetical protein